jgi:hypothetical protein
VPLAELPALTEQTYIANGGSTALNDAVMQTLDEYTSLTTDATANVVLVITDGQENSSKHSRAQAIAVIDRLKAKGTWTFAYIGSDPSTWAEAGAYGFASGSTWTYTPTYGGTVSAYAIVSESMSSLRSLVNSSDVTSTADFFNQATSDTVKKPVTP